MTHLSKIFLIYVLGLLLAGEVKPKDYHPEETTNINGKDARASLTSTSLFLTPEQDECVANYPGLKAEYIKEGVTIIGVLGTSSFTFPNCSEDISENCITSLEFPAVEMKGIADKLALNQKVGGVSGTIAVQTQLDCSGSNQSDCIATATYKTMNIGEQGGGGAAGLTTANFETRVSSNDSFEYWDASGNRNISSGDADLITNNVKSGVNILGTDGPTDPLNCASIVVGGTWIMVPGDPNYGTNDFCVMKYEAKCSEANGQDCSASMSTESPSSTAANTPWVSIDQQDAKTECASLGKGFHLISNDEWMTIGVNLVGVGSNWSNGAVGNAQLIRGHSDNDPAQACAASSDDSLNVVETDCTNQASANDDFIEQRTHTLSNGEVIWDLAGNVWESTSYFNDEEKPTPLGDAWDEFTDISGTSTMLLTDLLPQIAIDNNWNSTESIGMYYPGLDSSGGALRRGGRWDVPSSGGVFATRLNNPPTNTSPNIGFRCAVAVP